MEENLEIEKDMTPVLLEDLGMRFATEKSKRKHRYGLYQCQYCGKEFETQSSQVRGVGTISCGCQSKRYISPHGMYKHRLYQTWKNMKDRCNNPKTTHYKEYGGRGIQVCDRWLDIKNFIEDMYPSYQEGLSLDRIDVNGNYEPDNCRWATKTTQMQNTKSIHSNNTSGFRGVYWCKDYNKWRVIIRVNNKQKHLGYFTTSLEAAKAYETYVRLNNLEHNFTPALTPEEIEALYEKES